MVATVKQPVSRRFGWVPDMPDHRDHRWSAPLIDPKNFPPKIDLRPKCPAIYDQLSLGSCTANAIAGVIQFDQMRQELAEVFTPSRLFIYYNERAREHTVAADSGASLRDGIKCVAAKGACPETLWPYVDDGQAFAERPPQNCYSDALQHRAVNYARLVRSITQIKACLAAGFLFVYGFSVYKSFVTAAVADSGIVPMPTTDEQLLGGHAVAAVGYDDSRQTIITRNSWGSDWGVAGYCLMPYDYLLNENLSDDFWVIRMVQ